MNFSFSKSRVFNPSTTLSAVPLSEKKNVDYQTFGSSELPKRNFSTLLANMEEPENIKIKIIEDKYRKMLSQYEDKKKAIDTELLELKSGRRKNSVDLERK